MRIRLRHCATNLFLKSLAKNYSHPGTSGQQIVGADGLATSESLWLVKGSDALGENYPKGEPVRNGDTIRLEHVSTQKNLHSHARKSPLTGQQEVTACGEVGKADANDDWTVDLGSPGEWLAFAPMRLEFGHTGYVLHSHSGYNHPAFTAGLQEVTALPKSDSNDMWQAEPLAGNAKARKGQMPKKLSRSKDRRFATHNRPVLVFISHSTTDARFARSLVRLLRAALGLTPDQIRCTSVDGYNLPGGANVEETLRREVNECTVLIGVVTPASMKSSYVLFELGARWGRGADMVPLLARAGRLRAPLSSLHALDSRKRAHLYQLVTELAPKLGVPVSQPQHYEDEIREAIREAKKGGRYS